MKKLLTKILIGVLAVVTMLGALAGCGGSTWNEPSLTSWGEGNIVGGFIGEKGDYVYYINGVASNTNDNTFGAPVKGALMVADKNDLSKTEIVVPKLFVASDYKAGLYIYGDRVYYGTPNTDKTSTGDIANTELTFASTKLDGSDTVEYFTLASLSAEYRVVEKEGVVYIVYYDSEDTALEVYNCNDGSTQTIAKTDAEVAGKNGESLGAYKFAENGSAAIVYYTVTVYDQEYNENNTEERATASYNKVYAYKVGDNVSEQTAYLDGSKAGLNPATYEIKMAKFGELFYSETINGETKVYVGVGDAKTRIKNETAIADTTLFVLNENTGLNAYTVTEGKIENVNVFDKSLTKTVAINTGATTLLAVNGDYIYFVDAESGISRIELNNGEANVEKISNDTVNTAWYPVQFIGKNMFYCDNSATGASYIKYVDVTADVVAKDTDDDGENDKFYLQGQALLGIMTEEDKVTVATAKVNAITTALVEGVLPFETDANGNLYVQAVNDAADAVKGLEISEETTALLEKYQKAIEKANLYNKLEGIRYETTDKDFETAYNEVKDQIEAFMASEDYAEISAYIGQNRLWNYQQAKTLYGDK